VRKPLDAAQRAAASGFHAVFSVDHLFPPGAPDRPGIEPFSLLSAVAARHAELGVGVLVTRAGFRPPGLLAKQAAALDHLSGGGAILGIGMGDHLVRAEHEMLGLPFPDAAERAARLEETALALRALVAGTTWPGGEHVPSLAGPLLPPGRPPVWLGGTGQKVIEAAGRSADGWNGWGLDGPGFAERARSLERVATDAGRDPADVLATWGGIVLVGEDRADLARLELERAAQGPAWTPWVGTVEDLRAFVEELRAAGCAWFICTAAGPDDRLELISTVLREA
jgi:alkanesulfonate monooxygenase SsuD/methylene tetrahydromethanopterin reductase-like flavin-dependent oxidoreductase (luciferase family)